MFGRTGYGGVRLSIYRFAHFHRFLLYASHDSGIRRLSTEDQLTAIYMLLIRFET